MSSPSPDNLHFILFPLMAPGHMIPMVDIAKILAQRGITVTIFTTPLNANRFKSVIDRSNQHNLAKIHFLELHLPLSQVGLPDGCENFDLLPSAALATNLFAAMMLLEQPAERMLRGLTVPPSCIVADHNGFPWATDVANRLNIPRVVFYGPGCFPFVCTHVVARCNLLDQIGSDYEYFVVPGLPDRIEVTKPQASCWGKGKMKERIERFERTEEAEKGAYGIVVNSFLELEPEYVSRFAKVKGKKVWCVGPVSLCNQTFLDVSERGTKFETKVASKVGKKEIDYDFLKWLDSREPGSVVYVCLGSLSNPSVEQAIEISIGLESSNTPFIWFVRRTSDEFEKWLLEQRYEERVRERGILVRGWAPQILILSHPAIGGFVTHCGWNSTLEGISAGIPMVTWPHFSEQFLNERFIIDVLKIGVRIGAEVPFPFGEKDKFEVKVKRGDIKMAIESLMDDGEEGMTRRKRAKELAEMAKKSMEEGGSSYRNMTSMIEDITEQLMKNK